jgi:hypothetical protein
MPKGDISVRLEIVIGKDGSVEKAQCVAGMAALVEETVRAALQWKFSPKIDEGGAKQVLVQIDDTVTPAPYSPQPKLSPGIPGGYGDSMAGVIGGIRGGSPDHRRHPSIPVS